MPLDEDMFATAEPAPRQQPKHHWRQKVIGLLVTILCFEIGFFLLVFPWTELWSQNYFAHFGPRWNLVWNSPYFRGAVSGIGIIDLYISFLEILRLRRFSGGV